MVSATACVVSGGKDIAEDEKRGVCTQLRPMTYMYADAKELDPIVDSNRA